MQYLIAVWHKYYAISFDKTIFRYEKANFNVCSCCNVYNCFSISTGYNFNNNGILGENRTSSSAYDYNSSDTAIAKRSMDR